MQGNQRRRIAFYAPLKPPTAPKPSGDRLLARLLMKGLEEAGYTVTLASEFRALDLDGDRSRQSAIRDQAESIARDLIEHYQHNPAPEIWFSYHLYHKAPDWIGPVVSAALDIPYVVAEASFAPKQQHGRWHMGHQQVARCLASVDGLVVLNPIDLEMVQPELRNDAEVLQLPALIDTSTFNPQPQALSASERRRFVLENGLENGLDTQAPWLIAVAMMRPGDKQSSFEFLKRALDHIETEQWQLLIAGDGQSRPAIERYFDSLRHRVFFLGQQSSSQLARVYSIADIMAWPAVNEAIGMALLEAQACGLPVVAGRSGGVATVVEHQQSGLVVDIDNGELPFAKALTTLLADATKRRHFGQSAVARVQQTHSLKAAARLLKPFLEKL